MKSDLHIKEEKLSNLSETLKTKENTLDKLSDSLAKSQALVAEKDSYLTEDEMIHEHYADYVKVMIAAGLEDEVQPQHFAGEHYEW